MKKVRNSAVIMDVGIASTTRSEVLSLVREEMHKKANRKPFFVVTANPEMLVASRTDPELKTLLKEADLVTADGIGVVWASQNRLPETVPGRVLVEQLLSKKPRVFFLGGRNGVAKEMANKFGGEWDQGEENIKFSILNLKTNQNSQNLRIIQKINKYKPDLLLVAYGVPWEEKWIWRNLDKLNAKVVIGVGGTFDYLTGNTAKVPNWVSSVGLEWLWRLVHEPWRWRRQLKLVEFVWRVWRS